MRDEDRPVVRAMRGEEAEALLRRNHVGRLAFALMERVDVEPVHYVYDAPWIFGRTSTGAKVLTLARNQWCAFETDEVQGMFDWMSVVAKGPFCPQYTPGATWSYDRALAALRRLFPATLTAADPTPHRDIIYGVHVSEITGRSSVSSHEPHAITAG